MAVQPFIDFVADQRTVDLKLTLIFITLKSLLRKKKKLRN